MTVEIGLVVAGVVIGLMIAYCGELIVAMLPNEEDYNPEWMDYEKWSGDRD